MKLYLASLAAGVIVGILYSLLHVRSPAPPLVALVGLLGILIGEQLIPTVREIVRGDAMSASSARNMTLAHIFGELPGRHQVTVKERQP